MNSFVVSELVLDDFSGLLGHDAVGKIAKQVVFDDAVADPVSEGGPFVGHVFSAGQSKGVGAGNK